MERWIQNRVTNARKYARKNWRKQQNKIHNKTVKSGGRKVMTCG